MTNRYLDLTDLDFGTDVAATLSVPFAPQNVNLYSYFPTVPNSIDPQTFIDNMFAQQPRMTAMGRVVAGSQLYPAITDVFLIEQEGDNKTLLDLYGKAYEAASAISDPTVERAVKEAHKRAGDRKAIFGESARAIRRRGQIAVSGFAMYEISPGQSEGILAISKGVVEASRKVLTKRDVEYTPEMYWPLAAAILSPKRQLEMELEKLRNGRIVKPRPSS